MTSENHLIPGFGPSYEISQTRLGFADRNIHWLPNLLAEVAPQILVPTLIQIKPVCAAYPSLARRRDHPRRSGGAASPASASSASSTPIAACALEPRRRRETVFSLASLRPKAISTGIFAKECSRTL